MYEERSSNWFSLCNVSQPINQSVSLSSNNLDNYCATLHYDNHNVDYCILAYCDSISCTWSHSFMYMYVTTFKKVKVVCQASLVEEKELLQIANTMQLLLQVHTMQFILHRNARKI